MALEELHERVGVVHLGPAFDALFRNRVVHRADGLAAAVLERGDVRHGPEGLGGLERIGEVVLAVGVEFRRGVHTLAAEHVVDRGDHLVVLLAVEVDTAQQAQRGVARDVAVVVVRHAALVGGHQRRSLDEVVANLVVDLSHGGPHGRVGLGRGAEHDAQIVTPERVGFGVERHQMQVADGAHEVVFAQHMVVLARLALGKRLDDRVGRVDDVVGAPPEIGVGLVGHQVAVAHLVVERVLGLVGQRDVVAAELGHLEIVADVGVARVLGALVGQHVLEHRIVAVGAVDRRSRVAGELVRSHGVRGEIIQVAGRGEQRQDENRYDFFHRFGIFRVGWFRRSGRRRT